jgi:hypothetical protein
LVNFYQTTRCYNPEESNILAQDNFQWWAFVKAAIGLYEGREFIDKLCVSQISKEPCAMKIDNQYYRFELQEATRSSETVVTTYKTTRRHNREGRYGRLHRREIVFVVLFVA